MQVPAGSASGQPQIQSVFGFPASVGQPVTPGQVVPVTVHHNGCYGSTDVEKTLDELGGVLSGVTGGKIDHFTLTGTKFTFTPDVAISDRAGQCPAGKATASDSCAFTTDGYTATVTFTMNCRRRRARRRPSRRVRRRRRSPAAPSSSSTPPAATRRARPCA